MNTRAATTRRTSWRGSRLAAAALATLLLGCGRSPEGETCQKAADASAQNPCAAGLTCQTPPGCVGSYCCPTPTTMSTNANCNGTACVGS